MKLHLKFLGAAQEVTGSCILAKVSDIDKSYQILIDAGMKQSRHEELEHLDAIDVNSIRAIILTHGHIDHSGGIPYLVKKGFKGEIHCTTATMNVANLLWKDAVKVTGSKYYDEYVVMETMRLMHPHDYDQPFDLDMIKVTFLYAAHILGAASVLMEAGNKRFVFSGDLGSKSSIIHDKPTIPTADYLVMESTYGNKIHSDLDTRNEQFLEEIEESIGTGGSVLIPVFAIGRAQEILVVLKNFKEHGRLKDVKVIFDSPLGKEATKLYIEHKAFLKSGIVEAMTISPDFFTFSGLQFTENLREKGIILSSSGMLSGGKVMVYAKQYLPDPNSKIIFVGYQGKGTNGRALLDGEKSIELDGEIVSINAKVRIIDGFSAHADSKALIDYALKSNAKEVYLMHGEIDAITSLKTKLEKKGVKVYVPNTGEEKTFEAEVLSKQEDIIELPNDLHFYTLKDGRSGASFAGAIIREGNKIRLVPLQKLVAELGSIQESEKAEIEQVLSKSSIPAEESNREAMILKLEKIKGLFNNGIISKKQLREILNYANEGNIRELFDYINRAIEKSRITGDYKIFIHLFSEHQDRADEIIKELNKLL